MAKGTLTLEKISVTGEFTMPASGAPALVADLIAAELNIDRTTIVYIDDLTPQGGGLFTWAAREPAGARYDGADWPTKKPKTVDHSTSIYAVSAAAAFQCNFIAYVNQLNT